MTFNNYYMRTKSTQRWDRYKRCSLFTDTSNHSLNFDLDYKDYEMIAVVLETYGLDTSEITGIEITKCKYLCND